MVRYYHFPVVVIRKMRSLSLQSDENGTWIMNREKMDMDKYCIRFNYSAWCLH